MVVGIFLVVYSSIDLTNITLPFSLIMCCNTQGIQKGWNIAKRNPKEHSRSSWKYQNIAELHETHEISWKLTELYIISHTQGGLPLWIISDQHPDSGGLDES